MNVCIRNTFVSLWLLLGTVSLSAQGPSFILPYVNNAAPGSFKLLPLKVVNLDSVVSMQMVFRWDPKVLKFLAVTNLNFSDLNLADFNTSRALDSGYVRLQWEGDSAPPGFSVPDSTIIFRLRFQVIGPDTSSTAVQITELLDFPPTYFEIVKVNADGTNEDYLLNECVRIHGFVAVGYTVGTSEAEQNTIPLSLSPNPFSVSANVQFELDETADVQVVITDALGRIVQEKRLSKLPPGQHGMVIENTMLGVPGLYSLSLRAGRKTATHRLVLF